MNIIQALAAGFTVDQVLDLLNTKYPSLSGKLKSAQKSGLDVQKFLRTFQGASPKDLHSMEERSKHSPNPLISGGAASRKSSAQTFGKEKLLPAAAALGASALGAYGLTRAAPAIAQGIQGMFGGGQTPLSGTNPGPSPSPGPTPMANAPVKAPSIAQPHQTDVSVAAGAVSPPQEAPVTPQQPPLSPAKQRATQFFQKLGVEEKVKELAAQGKTPEQIAAEIQTGMHPSTRKSYIAKRARGEEIPIQQHVKEYVTTPEGFLREDVIKFGTKEEEPPEDEFSKEQPETTKKGSIVATPDGVVGTVKDTKEKEALIESDGKLHKAKIEDLIESPLPEKDTADLLDELNEAIGKETGEEVSRAVRLVAYVPEKNLALFIPWGGQPYLYDDLSEEDRKFLTEHTQKRRTTGESLIGVWTEGTKSIMGSKMSDWIRKLQKERGGKGNEYAAKFQTVYDPHGHAIEAKKKKFKEGKKK